MSGIPARLYPGFWDNVAQCCGSAGVADYFVLLHEVTGKDEYLEFACCLLDDVVRRAVEHGNGVYWHNIEHRMGPSKLPAQTTYMQGAAGIGDALLRASDRLLDVPTTYWLPAWR